MKNGLRKTQQMLVSLKAQSLPIEITAITFKNLFIFPLSGTEWFIVYKKEKRTEEIIKAIKKFPITKHKSPDGYNTDLPWRINMYVWDCECVNACASVWLWECVCVRVHVLWGGRDIHSKTMELEIWTRICYENISPLP